MRPLYLASVLLLVAAYGCAAPAQEDASSTVTSAYSNDNNSWKLDTDFQFGTIDYMAKGKILGTSTIRDVKQGGTFGLGTYDYVGGEMMVLDGIVYKWTSNGVLGIADDNEKTPFAEVTAFAPNVSLALPSGQSVAAVGLSIDAVLPDLDQIWAIKVHGTFASITTRAPPPGVCNPTCPGLLAILAGQLLFTRTNEAGTLVGWRHPAPFGKTIDTAGGGINTAGYHFHFVSDDRTHGGHVISFTSGGDLVAQADDKHEFHLVYPGGDTDNNHKDHDHDDQRNDHANP